MLLLSQFISILTTHAIFGFNEKKRKKERERERERNSVKFMRSSGQGREKINLTVLERFSSERERKRERDVNFWTHTFFFLQNKLKVEQTFEFISH